ncbi:translocation/assembly module TamB domain-containing protein [Crenobacter cavernae]|uniref:Translocation/assembly module TamB n=1 Tax=Crenobacter cavernae TaxID=2290923 RepID=A0ABY0FD39_9NEIS|nr:translocation/assembly module TamB domain-containing protein [Crenobacter cavernae]RXZ43980.1 translocation/assembly module TamB [Crenobacter cavernae]
MRIDSMQDDRPAPTPPSGPSQEPPPSTPPRRRRSVWRSLVIVGFPVLAALLTLLAWLTASASGFSTLTRHLDTLSAGRLKVAQSSGTLWDGFELAGVVWQGEYEKVELDRLKFAWQSRALWQGELWIKQLALGHVRLTPLKPAPPSKPAAEPEDLSLPIEVRLDAVTLASFSQKGEALLFDLVAGYRYDGKAHRLDVKRLGSPWGRAEASLSLAGSRPFKLAGRLKADGTLEGRAFAAQFELSSGLLAPRIQGTVTGENLLAEIDGSLAPFAARAYHKVRALDVRIGGVNPRAFNKDWPAARLNLAVLLRPTEGDALEGGVSVNNLTPGKLSDGALPFDLVAGTLRIDDEAFTLEDTLVQLLAGRVKLAGSVRGDAIALDATLAEVGLAALHAKAPNDKLNGKLTLTGTTAAPTLALDVAGKTLSANGRLSVATEKSGARTLNIESLRVGTGAGGGGLALAGKLGLDGAQRFSLAGQLRNADLARLAKGLPSSDLNGKVSASGRLAAPLTAALVVDIANSRLSGSPLSARIDAALAGERLTRLAARVALAENRLDASGRWGAPGDVVDLKLDAPALSRIGPGFAGSARGDIRLSGSTKSPQLDAKLRVDGLAAPGGIKARLVDFEGVVRVGGNTPFKIALAASEVAVPGQAIDTLRLDADGNRGAHRIEASGALKLQGRPHTLLLSANGGLAPDALAWRGTVNRLALAGDIGLQLLAPVKLAASADTVSVSSTRFALAGGTVRLDALDWRAGGTLKTKGALDALALARLEPWLKLPVEQSLVFAADWDLALGESARGQLTVRRQAGDVVVQGRDGRKAALELDRAEAVLRLSGGRALVDLNLTSRFALLTGQLSLAAPRGLPVMTAPMTGRVQFAVGDLSRLKALTGPGLELAGQAAADLTVSGTPAAPQWRGRIVGSGLTFADRKSGLKLSDGELVAQVDGRELTLERLRFAGGRGEVVAAGRLAAREAGTEANATVEFKSFTLLDSPERRLVVSGVSEIALTPQGITLTGRLRADRGSIDLPKEGAPLLSDDVVVKGRQLPVSEGSPKLPITLALELDLGDRFRLSGQGLNVTLIGVVKLAAKPGEAPTALGQVSVVKGRYKAYGQDLDIERGVITFAGPIDNPNLSVRAKRRFSPVGAGVEVTGTVSSPSVRLVADEPMSEKDKLAWLVLGRAASTGGGDDASLAASAGAFLAGSLNEQIGLFDDLGVTSRGEKTYASGRVSPAEQVVVVGKQLTRELFIGYEYGIRSAEQAVKFAYQFSKSWSVVLRAGNADSSAETRFTRRFD